MRGPQPVHIMNPRDGDRRFERREAVAQAVEAFQRGIDREESFAVIYQSYFAALVRFFRFKGISPEECRDLTQETFVGIYRGLKGYQHSDRFEGWIYRIAETCFLKRLRAAATLKRAAVEISTDSSDLPQRLVAATETQLGSMIEKERAQQLRTAIRALPDQMRRCLTLRLYQGLSYKEIGIVMRLQSDTVKAHLTRAKKRLAESLNQPDLFSSTTAERRR